MDNYTVYMHISPSGKRYIGITCTKTNRRWQNGNGYKTQQYFYRAIKKYGWDNFEHIIIAKGLDEETSKWLEIELIREWNTTNKDKGYNVTLGGEGGNGWTPSEETRKKLSEARKGENNPNYGKPLPEETKRKLSEVKKGKTHSEETRKKMSESRKGEKHPMYGKCGENNPNYGKHRSEETKKKMSESRIKRGITKSVICITTNMIFTTVKEGTEYYNCNNISSCCKGRRKSAGKLPDGTKLVWRFIEIIEL